MEMPAKSLHDPATSEYVRDRLHEQERGGKEQKQIARDAGVAPSLVNQILRQGQGVGSRSVEKWAKYLGFKDRWDFNRAVEAWWKAKGERLYTERQPEKDPHPTRAEASRLAREYGATETAIASTIQRWKGHESAPVLQWLAWFHEEIKLERERDSAHRRSLDEDAKVRRAFRGAADTKKKIVEVEAKAPPPVAAPTKKRRVARA